MLFIPVNFLKSSLSSPLYVKNIFFFLQIIFKKKFIFPLKRWIQDKNFLDRLIFYLELNQVRKNYKYSFY